MGKRLGLAAHAITFQEPVCIVDDGDVQISYMGPTPTSASSTSQDGVWFITIDFDPNSLQWGLIINPAPTCPSSLKKYWNFDEISLRLIENTERNVGTSLTLSRRMELGSKLLSPLLTKVRSLCRQTSNLFLWDIFGLNGLCPSFSHWTIPFPIFLLLLSWSMYLRLNKGTPDIRKI